MPWGYQTTRRNQMPFDHPFQLAGCGADCGGRYRGSAVSGARTGARRLQELAGEFSGRDLSVLRQVADFRLMSARQISAVHFSIVEHASAASAARACRRSLERLSRDRALIRLERRIGGIRAGSSSFIYAIGPVGERLLNLPGPRYRHREPSAAFVAHTLAVADLVVAITAAVRRGDLEILHLEAEPMCWRRVGLSGGGTTMLRPDLFVGIGVGALEYRWFCEVDLGTEHLPTLLRKCHAYETYYRSGAEQAAHGVFPTVVWIMDNQQRARRLSDAIADQRTLTRELFTVITPDRAVETLRGGAL